MNNIIYVDLNSCFATVEQQARPRLRYKPVAITNRLVPNSCIIAASYEAKACGIKVGTRRAEALELCPNIIFAETEPSKYIYVHHKFRQILESYSANVAMKSIDEGVIDLNSSPDHRPATTIGREIKQRLKDEIGCYMRCNVGIASNRFLAKLAAGLHKPDGLDEITKDNLLKVYSSLTLLDLPGINVRMERRLNSVGIFTPLDFYHASEDILVKMVCRSINGTKWYQRLRGIEVDDVDYGIKSIGREYVLDGRGLPASEIEKRLLHLAEDVGYRLRSKGMWARGIMVWGRSYHGDSYKKHCLSTAAFNTDEAILTITRQLFKNMPKDVRVIGVTLYKIQPHENREVSLFYKEVERSARLCQAEDSINNRFGPRTIHRASTLGTDQVKAKIPFGSTRYLDKFLSG
ncbi:hypothetical protein IKG54_00725 [Candidatus Saccharibacteria bacterium]|nr:hypothetical protein [Candidatus Saccharibacteria bacterium]